MDNDCSFGAWLQLRRKALALTQGDLARLVGCAEVTVQKIEADERRPSVQVAVLLATHLRLPAELHARFTEAARGTRSVDQLPPPNALDAAPPTRVLAEPMIAPAHNLPVELSSFVGRVRELGLAETLLRDNRLLTLSLAVTAGREDRRLCALPRLGEYADHGLGAKPPG